MVRSEETSFGFCIAVAEYENSCVSKSGPCVVVEDCEFVQHDDPRCAVLWFDECRQGLGCYRFERNTFTQMNFFKSISSHSLDFFPASIRIDDEDLLPEDMQFVEN